MTIDLKIYDRAVLKNNRELTVGDLIEASHGSRIDVRLSGNHHIPYSKCNPTGIFGVAIGRLKNPIDLEESFKSIRFESRPGLNDNLYPQIIARPGTMMVKNLVHTYERLGDAPIYMYTDFDMNNDSKGLAIVIGNLTGFTTKEKTTKESVNHPILSNLLPGFIEYQIYHEGGGCSEPIDFSTVKQKIIEHIVQRDKMSYVFKAPDGNKYPLEQILLSLEEQKD